MSDLVGVLVLGGVCLTSSARNSGDVESQGILSLLRRVDGVLRRIACKIIEGS